MKFSIITPSFRNSNWLKLCIASVADQEGVQLEHIVQDSCSDDGTGDWLPNDPRVKAFIEKDAGMYDAVNRGIKRATGDVIAYLNCDEQYLPGALKAVLETFEKSPATDIVLADTIIVDAQGDFICCRKSLVPQRLMKWTFLPTLTSAIFFHRRLIDQFNLYFDVRWRDLGDAIWMKEAVDLHLKMKVLRRYTSLFTDTGENMNLKPNALHEKQLFARLTPRWARWFHWPLLRLHRVRSACAGIYWEKPFTYSPYTLANPAKRKDVFVAKPTGIWWARHAHAKPARPL